MSGESNRLKDQAAALDELARQLESTFADPEQTAVRLIDRRRWLGPEANRVRDELGQTTVRLRTVAEAVRDRARELRRQAQHIEDTDGVGEDLHDLVTGRDFTPWS
jgi:hypothetical protein